MDGYTEITDEEMVDKIRLIDQELYVVIVERYQNKLLRYVTNLIGDENKATDVVQEAFIKAFVNLNSFDLKKKFSSWIYRIAHNESMNIVKKYRKEVAMPNGVDFQSNENIEYKFEQNEISVKVLKCLDGIPLLYSETLTLRYIEEKSYEEISDILRIPMGTVATRIARGKKLMKHLCQKN